MAYMKGFKSLDDDDNSLSNKGPQAPVSKGAPTIDWKTPMPFGKHKGQTPEQVSLADPLHANGYFTRFDETGGIKLTRECKTLLEDVADQHREGLRDRKAQRDEGEGRYGSSSSEWDDDIPF